MNLLCIHCSDVRALRIGQWTRCRCGRSRARYLDRILAEISGEACLLLSIRNDRRSSARRCEIAGRNASVERHDLVHEFVAFVIPFRSHVRMRKSTQRKNVQ